MAESIFWYLESMISLTNLTLSAHIAIFSAFSKALKLRKVFLRRNPVQVGHHLVQLLAGDCQVTGGRRERTDQYRSASQCNWGDRRQEKETGGGRGEGSGEVRPGVHGKNIQLMFCARIVNQLSLNKQISVFVTTIPTTPPVHRPQENILKIFLSKLLKSESCQPYC